MKKILIFFFLCSFTTLIVTSCVDPEVISFDSTLLIGKWEENGLYERYDSDGGGATWDIKDDVTEEEAEDFNWTVNGSTLYQEHILFNGAIVPKTYTLVTLNSTQLTYHDDYGTYHYFTRVSQ